MLCLHLWEHQDSNLGSPKAPDLQSGAIVRYAILPCCGHRPDGMTGIEPATSDSCRRSTD